MTSITTTTVRTHRRGLAVVAALTVLVLAAVAVLLVKTSPAHGLHHLVTGSTSCAFSASLLGGGHLGS
jgi:hypothetical protein